MRQCKNTEQDIIFVFSVRHSFEDATALCFVEGVAGTDLICHLKKTKFSLFVFLNEKLCKN